ncbi:MAG: acetate kinase [bacterium]|nr:acetate kinase [Candidatus Sumerlaeota bacterium]
MKVLVLNVGSSSVKFVLIETSVEAIDNENEQKLGRGLVDKIGIANATVKFTAPGKAPYVSTPPVWDHAAAIKQVITVITDPEHGVIKDPSEIDAVGHRIVHGGEYFAQSVVIDDNVAEKITECFELAPLHNPHNLKGYQLMKEFMPYVPHVAVFDTSFHQTMPRHAFLYALPYSTYQKYKVRRYGFHGTSHRYMVYSLEKHFAKKSRCDFKAITVHLGNGCSITAIDKGNSVDTSMGFTPLEGLIMGTRCGDIDPALVLYLMAQEEISLNEMNTMMNKYSGLAGLSGFSNDVRELSEEMMKGNERAELALRAFAYRVRKYIGSYMAALDGADYIAFTGGIGENSVLVREMVMENLDRLGIVFDRERNANVPSGGGEISAEGSPVRVFAIPTDEELVIARDTVRCIAASKNKPCP